MIQEIEGIFFIIIYDYVAKPLHSLCLPLVTCDSLYKKGRVSNTIYSIAAGVFPDMGGNS